jgi:hypothetical protein
VTLIVEVCGPFQWKPGRYETCVMVRYWWGWFAVARLKVSHREYAETSYDWMGAC